MVALSIDLIRWGPHSPFNGKGDLPQGELCKEQAVVRDEESFVSEWNRACQMMTTVSLVTQAAEHQWMGGRMSFSSVEGGRVCMPVAPLARTSEIAEGRLTKSFEPLSSPN